MEPSQQENGGIISVQRLEPIFVQPEKKPYNGMYLLSSLDQAFVAMMKTIYVYNLDGKTSSELACDVIKQALAKVLVHYYPFSGRLRTKSDGKLFVECIATEGVPFVEAIADFNIDQLGDITPDNPMLQKFIYEVPGVEKVIEMPLMTAQITRFKSGSFVLGLTMSHGIADGRSAMEFVNSWAETARGISLTTPPVLSNSILMSRKLSSLNKEPTETDNFNIVDITDVSNMESLYQEENMVYKSFRFDQKKLAGLKKAAMDEDAELKYCSSFTVLAALLWRARSQALKMKPDQQTKLLFTVDIRSKLNPPLPKGFFGNGAVTSECTCTASELIENPFSFAVKMVQKAIQKVNDDYVQSCIEFFEHVNMITGPPPSFTGTLVITSWTRIPFNTVDFGWGEPTQFGSAEIPKEVCVFCPSGKENNAILLVLGLPVSAMNTFQELMNQV